jgi:putative phage-type endonuclease
METTDMQRITHTLTQGTPEWHAFRREHFGASEAAAMLGISPYTTRDALLHQKATGESPEVSPALQAVFDRGHETEIGGRALAEAIIGDDLFPVTMSLGKLSASCDGLTMNGSIAFEHKQFNTGLSVALAAGALPESYQPQCQQVLLVTGAEKLLFMTSDGTDSHCVWMWVYPDPAWADKLVNGWTMFESDLRNYTPPEVVREAIAAPQETLPAVTVQVSGSLAVFDNLKVFGEALTAYVARINQKPETDDDFATLERQAKDLKKAEDALTAAENGALAQASSIDEMRRAVAQYREIARAARLTAEKVVKAEKENRKNKIIKDGHDNLREFLDRVLIAPADFPMSMPALTGDFTGVTRGLKTLSSIQNAVNTELARVKIIGSEEARKIAGNLQTIVQAGNKHLFADYKALALKAPDDLAAVIAQRIAAAKAEEDRKLEAERTRIRAEEEAKAKAAQEAAALPRPTSPIATASNSESNPIATSAGFDLDEFRKNAGVPALSPEERRAAVIEHQDEISAFLASREWKIGEETKARAILVEFVKFTAARQVRRAA